MSRFFCNAIFGQSFSQRSQSYSKYRLVPSYKVHEAATRRFVSSNSEENCNLCELIYKPSLVFFVKNFVAFMVKKQVILNYCFFNSSFSAK